jgi:hypothetical protein
MADAFSDQVRGTDVPEAAVATGRALVPLTLSAAPPENVTSIVRPDARFVAHLIATATHAPQTRIHRRTSVEDVLTHYANAYVREQVPAPANGSALSRVA